IPHRPGAGKNRREHAVDQGAGAERSQAMKDMQGRGFGRMTPALLRANASVLLLIDFQERLVPAIDDGEAAVEQARRLALAARRLGVPVLATEQLPDRLGPIVPAL